MKIREVFDFVSSVKEHAYDDKVLLRLINQIEARICSEIMLLAPSEVLQYSAGQEDSELLAPPPHDEVYIAYLNAMIDHLNGEYDKYAVTLAYFNEVYGEFERWFSQVYSPAGGFKNELMRYFISAYGIAVKNGFSGTEAEWLLSLVGKPGADGKPGSDGKSAYEIAREGGFGGTEEEFNAIFEALISVFCGNNKWYFPGSTAFGSDTVAGGKYFEVESYNAVTNENGTYYTFKVADYPFLVNDFTALRMAVTSAASDNNQYTNVYVSIRASYNFDFVGIIDDPAYVSAGARTIKFRFDHVSTAKFNTYLLNNPDTTTLWIPAHPELGSKIYEYPAHASGTGSIAQNAAADASGGNTIAAGRYAHTEGVETKAGYSSHAEGKLSKARGDHSHAEGYNSDALGSSAHSEGMKTKGYGDASHSEGIETEAGYGAHSENYRTKAKGSFTHAGGTESIANYMGSFLHGDHLEDCEEYQAIFGKFNKKVPGASFMLGNGTSDSDRKNIMEAYKNGDYRITALTCGEEIFEKDIKGFTTQQSLISKFDTVLAAYAVYKNSSIFIEGYDTWLTHFEALVGVPSGTLISKLPQNNVFYSVDNKVFNIPTELHLMLSEADGTVVDCGKVIGFIPIWSWQKIGIVTDKEIPPIEGLGDNTHLVVFAERPDVGVSKVNDKTFPKNKCFAGGTGLFTYNKNESAVGRYNASRGGMLYSVGNGTDDENRSNALEVYEDGHAEVGKTGESENSVVTLGYLTEKINELRALMGGE